MNFPAYFLWFIYGFFWGAAIMAWATSNRPAQGARNNSKKIIDAIIADKLAQPKNPDDDAGTAPVGWGKR